MKKSLFIFLSILISCGHGNELTITDRITNKTNLNVTLIFKEGNIVIPSFTLKPEENHEFKFSNEGHSIFINNQAFDSVRFVFADGKEKVDTSLFAKTKVNPNEIKNILDTKFYKIHSTSHSTQLNEYYIDSLDYKEANL